MSQTHEDEHTSHDGSAGGRLWRRTVDPAETAEVTVTAGSFSGTFAGAMTADFLSSGSDPVTIDLAASPSQLFVLFNHGDVRAYTHMGTPVRSATGSAPGFFHARLTTSRNRLPGV